MGSVGVGTRLLDVCVTSSGISTCHLEGANCFDCSQKDIHC